MNSLVLLRGLEIPAGKHQIKFEIVPETYNNSKMISFISSTLILIGLLYLIFIWVRNAK